MKTKILALAILPLLVTSCKSDKEKYQDDYRQSCVSNYEIISNNYKEIHSDFFNLRSNQPLSEDEIRRYCDCFVKSMLENEDVDYEYASKISNDHDYLIKNALECK
jgi:hypothetical protein